MSEPLVTYTDVVDALVRTVQRVPGLPGGVLDYEPEVVHEAPLVYLMFAASRQQMMSGLLATEYEILVRLVVPWVSAPEAERELKPFVTAIPWAISSDPYLGGLLALDNVSGMSRMHPAKDAVGVFVKIGNVVWRAVDYLVHVLEKEPAPAVINA